MGGVNGWGHETAQILSPVPNCYTTLHTAFQLNSCIVGGFIMSDGAPDFSVSQLDTSSSSVQTSSINEPHCCSISVSPWTHTLFHTHLPAATSTHKSTKYGFIHH